MVSHGIRSLSSTMTAPWKKVIATVPSPLGVAVNPLNGHLFVSSFSSKIYDVDPVTGTVSVFLDALADGLAFDPSAGILYAAFNATGQGDQVRGFNITTKAVVFDSGTIASVPDGIALGNGPVAGNLFVNTNERDSRRSEPGDGGPDHHCLRRLAAISSPWTPTTPRCS